MTVEVKLPLFIWKEEDQFVAFTPALDLSTCGDSEKDAVEHFREAVELFFETAEERNTLKELLESLGWKFKGNDWIPTSQPIDGRTFSAQVPIPDLPH